MFDGRWRNTVDRGTQPVGRRLQQLGLTADVLTASGLVFAAVTAVLVATGHLHWAIVALILTGFHDLLDGPVAKASGSASKRGAFFDSVSDRVADAVILGGVAWYVASAHPGHLVLLPFAVLAVTSLISYQRAKAESLGIPAKGGLMERAERMILLGVGFLATVLLVPVLWVMLALVSATAVGRFVRIWQAAEAPAPVTTVRRPRAGMRAVRADRSGRSERVGRRTSPTPSRWRARRQGELASRSGRTWRARHRQGQGQTARRSRAIRRSG